MFNISKLGMRKAIQLADDQKMKPLMASYLLNLVGLDEKLKCNTEVINFFIDHFYSSFNAKKNGNLLAWVNLPAPTEIFYAFDIIPFGPELMASLSSTLGFAIKDFEMAESYGISRDSCSFDSHLIGSSLLNSSPQADMLVSTTGTGCDAQGKSFEVTSYLAGIPVHHMSTPYRNNDPEAINYYKEELLRLIEFLEEFTGNKLDYEKLEAIVEVSNEASKCFRRSYELRRARPVPIGGIESIAHYAPITNFYGDMGRTEYFYKSLCSEIEQRIKDGIGVVNEDAIRILWLHFPPMHDLKLIKHIESIGGIVVFPEPALLWWDVAEGKNIIDALANKYTSIFSNGDAQKRIDKDLEIIKLLDVDAAIDFLHWGCKNFCSIATLTKDTLNEETGIPILEIDGDVVDPRNYASAQIRTRVEAFIEMLK